MGDSHRDVELHKTDSIVPEEHSCDYPVDHVEVGAEG